MKSRPIRLLAHTPVVDGRLHAFPLAAVNIFRVVAFRWTIELGTYDLKVADIFLTLAYVAFLLVSTRGGESAN
jgi:hypothetical protein